MNIKVKQSTLLKYLELVGKIATKHVTLPVLQCVVFVVKENEVKLMATNLEIMIEVKLHEAKHEDDGVFAVPAQILTQAIQNLKSEAVTIALEEDSAVTISTEKTVTTINTMSPEEFPFIQKINGEKTELKRKVFSSGVKATAFAASQSSIKPELGSVYIYQKKEQTLTFVATDSFRLMERTVSQSGLIFDTTLLVPQKNALELARVCDLLDSDPVLKITENQCALEFLEGVYISSRLVSGTFPDYNSIIPKEFKNQTTILKQDLVNTFKKTSTFLNKFRQVKVQVCTSELIVSAQSGEVGMVSDVVQTKSEGEEMTLSFNQQYLSEPLSHITADSLLLKFAGVGRPLVITVPTDDSVRYLVMPMNK